MPLKGRLPSLEFKGAAVLRQQCRLAHILAGTTCSPISLPDFELYLAYRERSLENLQFVVWYLDYRDRFFKLPIDVQRTSPDPAILAAATTTAERPSSFNEPLPTPSSAASSWFSAKNRRRDPPSYIAVPAPTATSPMSMEHYQMTPLSSAGTALSSPLLRLSPPAFTPSPREGAGFGGGGGSNGGRGIHMPPTLFSTPTTPTLEPDGQPFREETVRVVATFMRPGRHGKKELALDEVLRNEVLDDLVLTTHPEVFAKVYRKIYDQLEMSAHNFLTYQSANINTPKQTYWYAVGTVFTLLSILIGALLIHFVPAHQLHAPFRPRPLARAARLGALPFAMAGSMQLYSAYRQFCSEVFGRGGTQLKAWEMEDPSEAGVRWRKRKETPGGGTSQDHLVQQQQPKKKDVKSGRRKSSLKVIAPFDEEFGNNSATSLGNGAGGGGKSSSESPPGSSIEHRARHDLEAGPSSGRMMIEPTHEIAFVKPRRSQFGASYSRPPVFGPERVVLDTHIRKYHISLLTDMAWFGFWYSVVFAAAILSVPGPRPVR